MARPIDVACRCLSLALRQCSYRIIALSLSCYIWSPALSAQMAFMTIPCAVKPHILIVNLPGTFRKMSRRISLRLRFSRAMKLPSRIIAKTSAFPSTAHYVSVYQINAAVIDESSIGFILVFISSHYLPRFRRRFLIIFIPCAAR